MRRPDKDGRLLIAILNTALGAPMKTIIEDYYNRQES